MNRLKDWEEPWKKKEPGGRLSKKAKESQEHFQKQREKMERIHTQKVTIICEKSLMSPGLYKIFKVKLNIPLRKKEIDERMAAAFPECKWGKV